jgi:hypothetical protein
MMLGLMVFTCCLESRQTLRHDTEHHDPPDAFHVCFVLILSTMILTFCSFEMLRTGELEAVRLSPGMKSSFDRASA